MSDESQCVTRLHFSKCLPPLLLSTNLNHTTKAPQILSFVYKFYIYMQLHVYRVSGECLFWSTEASAGTETALHMRGFGI